MISWLKSSFRRRKEQPVIIGYQPRPAASAKPDAPPMPPKPYAAHTPPAPEHTPLLGRMASQPYPDPDRVQVARVVTVDDTYPALLATRLACTDDKPFPSSSYSCSGGYDSGSSSSD